MLPAVDPSVTEPLLTAQDVSKLLALSRRSVWRLVALGKLPPPVRISRRVVRWRPSDLRRHLDALTRPSVG